MVPHRHGDEPSRRKQRRRVLVVDDEPFVRMAVACILAQHFDVTAACSAREALRLLQSATFDAVVTDYKMPEHTGVWLLAQLRERYPSVRRIMISAMDIPDRQAHVQDGLVYAFFPKPVDGEALVACVGSS